MKIGILLVGIFIGWLIRGRVNERERQLWIDFGRQEHDLDVLLREDGLA
jgi:hypothetical protein